jgi:hypothetical protein
MQTLTNSANFGATLAEAEQHLAKLEPFHTGTLSAQWEVSELSGGPHNCYIVRSYGVEIAVYPEEWGFAGWVQSDAYSHSKTTSKHANIVKKAWDL